jgi:hypothetical protein
MNVMRLLCVSVVVFLTPMRGPQLVTDVKSSFFDICWTCMSCWSSSQPEIGTMVCRGQQPVKQMLHEQVLDPSFLAATPCIENRLSLERTTRFGTLSTDSTNIRAIFERLNFGESIDSMWFNRLSLKCTDDNRPVFIFWWHTDGKFVVVVVGWRLWRTTWDMNHLLVGAVRQAINNA